MENKLKDDLKIFNCSMCFYEGTSKIACLGLHGGDTFLCYECITKAYHAITARENAPTYNPEMYANKRKVDSDE